MYGYQFGCKTADISCVVNKTDVVCNANKTDIGQDVFDDIDSYDVNKGSRTVLPVGQCT